MTLSRLEQETIITYNNEEKFAEVYTCDPTLIRKMDALMKKDKRVKLDETRNPYSKSYIVPKRAIKVVMPRILSETERERLKSFGTKYASNLKRGV